MAKKRIIAHFMHEKERDACRGLLSNVEETDSYLIGDVEESDIEKLRQNKIIVQTLDVSQRTETPASTVEPSPGIERARSRPTMLPKLAESSDEASVGVDAGKPNFYIIKLKGPLIEAWRTELDHHNVRLLEYFPRYSYTVKLSPPQVLTITGLPFVEFIRPYGARDTGPIALQSATEPRPPTTSPISSQRRMLTYDLRLHSDEGLESVIQWLQQHKITIAGARGKKVRIYLAEDDAIADQVSSLPEVARMEEYVPPRLHNDICRTLLGIDAPQGGNPSSIITQTGAGQIIAVADTGLDDSHPDFKDRIIGIVALGRPHDFSDPHGHGTHVAGSVLGDGSASGGQLKGTAPGARLFFQSLLDAQGGLGGLPLSLDELFEEAYLAGARIHNNSWGAATESFYTANSIEVDEFVNKRRNMLVVISAGNEGQAAICKNSQQGFVDWLSIGSPASCKNALTVGASRSSRTAGGYSGFSFGQAWPDDFPDPPIAAQNVSGDSESMAAFSSRGPCDDKRIKPDVVAPGTDVASAKSSLAPLRRFWGPYPGNNAYAFMGGTSMSAPLVTGCAALVREYFVQDRHHDPSAALLKAALISGTRWLSGQDSIADFQTLPNFHQGFGCISLSTTIPNQTLPNFKLEFIDSWNDAGRQFTFTGQRFRFTFSITGGPWLRICLVWTDPPARALQNNLNLFVQNLQTDEKWIGNESLPMSLQIPDPDNNVEVVRLLSPLPGNYMVQITATNLLKTPQDFALVVGGDLSSQLQQV